MSQPDLWVVEVQDSIAVALIEHDGSAYVSPPPEREQALELAGLLLGHPVSANGVRDHLWRHAIAGGQRNVRVWRLT